MHTGSQIVDARNVPPSIGRVYHVRAESNDHSEFVTVTVTYLVTSLRPTIPYHPGRYGGFVSLEVHHFTAGWLTPVLAYVMSVTGSFLGLQCASRARAREKRVGWLCAAAIALGGTGIWVMHFVAMLGFSVVGATIKYDVPLTALSAIVAVAVVGIGLLIVNWRPHSIGALLAGGAITGSGVAAMHYTGMAAMNADVDIDYQPGFVLLSIVIAVVAAVAALWFTLWVDGLITTFGAALIMGIAVCGMHYVGMASMSAHPMVHHVTPTGSDPVGLITPLVVTVGLTVAELVLNIDMVKRDPKLD